MKRCTILEEVPNLSKEMAKDFYLNLNISPLPGRRYMLKEDYTIFNLTIPKGFVTNGADIPRPFWVFIPPFDPINLPFIILHDYFCLEAETKEDYQYANKLMKNFGIALKRHKAVVNTMYAGTEVYTRVSRPLLSLLGLYKKDKLTAFVREEIA